MKVLIFGNSKHTRNRILPAITKLKDIKIDLVTSSDVKSKIFNVENIYNYESIDLINQVYDVVFISTFPYQHIELLKKYSFLSKIFLIEKPIYTDAKQVNLNELPSDKFIIECLMYRYHPLFHKFIEIYLNNEVIKVESSFCIPDLDKENFRYNQQIGGGVIYDQGIYPLSLMSFVSKTKIYKIKQFKKYDKKLKTEVGQKVNFIIDDKVEYFAEWELGSEYKNQVKLYTKDSVFVFPSFFSKANNYLSYFEEFTDNNHKKIEVGTFDQFFLMYQELFDINEHKVELENLFLKQRYDLIKQLT